MEIDAEGTDQGGHSFWRVPFGWDEPKAFLRITYVPESQTVRFSKEDKKGQVFRGPEPEIKSIPLIIEALAKIYVDHNELRTF